MSQPQTQVNKKIRDEGLFRQLAFVRVDKDVGGPIIIKVADQVRAEVDAHVVWGANEHTLYLMNQQVFFNIGDPVTATAPLDVKVSLLIIEHRTWWRSITCSKEQPTQQVQ